MVIFLTCFTHFLYKIPFFQPKKGLKNPALSSNCWSSCFTIDISTSVLSFGQPSGWDWCWMPSSSLYTNTHKTSLRITTNHDQTINHSQPSWMWSEVFPSFWCLICLIRLISLIPCNCSNENWDVWTSHQEFLKFIHPSRRQPNCPPKNGVDSMSSLLWLCLHS